MGVSEGSVLPASIALASVVCIALAIHGASRQGKDKLAWQEHVARFFGAGIAMLLVGSVAGWTTIMVAGMLMFVPMTLVAVTGILYLLDDAVRGFRKR